MEYSIGESPWAVAFAVLLFFAAASRGLIWLILRVKRSSEGPPEAVVSQLKLPAEYRPEWWDVLILFGMSILAFLAAGSLAEALEPYLGEGLMPKLCASLIAPVVCISTGWVLLRRRGVRPFELWQWQWGQIPMYLLRGLDRYLLLFIPLTMLAAVSMWVFKLAGGEDLAQPLVKEFLELEDVTSVILLVVLAVVIAPIWEEIIFRGVLYPILRGLQDRIFAVLATGVLFGLVHGHGPAFVPLTFLGLALAWFYERSGQLGNCIGFHAAFNAATATMLLLVKYTS